MARVMTKDPRAVLDYQFDWSAWLGADTITAHAVTVTAGLTVTSTTASATAVTVWLSGGTVGAEYTVTCHIQTAGGREDDRSIVLAIWER